MDKPRDVLGDAQAFFGFPGKPLVIEKGMNLDLALMTAGLPTAPTGTSYNQVFLEASIKRYQEQLAALSQHLHVVTGAETLKTTVIQRLHKGQQMPTALVLGLQNTPDDVNLQGLFCSGIRVVAPAYQQANAFGSGFANAGIGLTERGQSLMEACAEIGMIVDLSHSGHQMARDIVAHAIRLRDRGKTLHVMASHGGCYSRYISIRNLPDDVLKGIAQLGGFVGIYTLTFGLDRIDNTLQPFTAHLRHAVQVCGPQNVGIGSDGFYAFESDEDGRQRCKQLASVLDPAGLMQVRYPEHPQGTYSPLRMDFLRNGMFFMKNKKELAGYCGENLYSFLRDALPPK